MVFMGQRMTKTTKYRKKKNGKSKGLRRKKKK